VSLSFILVVRGFEKTWCDEIERALKQRIREFVNIAKIWKPEVLVMNDEAAARWNIIVS
jgi:hypothetical protein